jgi:hypothetical protein
VSNVELIAVFGISVAACMSLVVCICLRGTTPEQRPAILRALAVLVRSTWPGSRLLDSPRAIPQQDEDESTGAVSRGHGDVRAN